MFTRRLRSGIQHSFRYIITLTLIGLSASGYAAGGGAVSETQTYCFGRFLIDLPKAAEINGQRYEYMFGAIETGRTPPKPNIHQDGFVEMMKAREADLRAVTKDGKYSYADSRLASEPKSRILVTSRTAFGSKAYGFEAYRSSNNVLFSMKVNAVGADGIDSVLKDLETRLLPNLRARKPNEIPSVPGFCIEQGFIADDGKTPQYEKSELSFKFKEWPDVSVSVYSRTNGDKLSESLLTRTKKSLPIEFAEAAKGIKTFRETKRVIGPHQGEEVLDALPTDDGYAVHHFVWDVTGAPRSIFVPHIHVELSTGSGRSINKRYMRPSLTDKQAIELYDHIVNSIRLRPTTPGKTSDAGNNPTNNSPATAPRLPLKTKATSAVNCPQTGMWECAADAPGITEHRRFIEAGQPMPYGIVQRPVTGLGGFLGKQEDDTAEVTWTLVAYDKDAS